MSREIWFRLFFVGRASGEAGGERLFDGPSSDRSAADRWNRRRGVAAAALRGPVEVAVWEKLQKRHLADRETFMMDDGGKNEWQKKRGKNQEAESTVNSR